MNGKKRGALREGWRIARPYWFAEDHWVPGNRLTAIVARWFPAEKWVARFLLVVIIAMTLFQVWINVRLNYWRNDFYDTLQNYDEAGFFWQIGIFILLATPAVLLGIYQTYLQQMLQIRWRRWMSSTYLRDWLDNKHYYRLQLGADATDNPDQRIAEDLSYFPAQTLALSLGLLGNIVNAVSFAFVLWSLSGALAIPLGSWGNLSIPGYMFWAVIIYIIAGSWMTIRVGRPLVPLSFAQQRLEADFRFSLVRFRENTESVAFYGGEDREYAIFQERFGHLFANFFAIMLRTRLLGYYTGAYSQAAVLFPYLLMAPRYFAERLALGVITQTVDAFSQFLGSLAWIINTYANSAPDLSPATASIAGWIAIVNRLTTFLDRIDEIAAAQRAPQPIAIERAGTGLAVTNLDLNLPNGRQLRHGINLAVADGQSVLIMGRTGTGKSTLLRALAGIWPFGRGTVRLDQRRAFFIPQKAYIPLGNLRHALTYPDDGTEVPQERLVAALEKVGLGHLAADLDKVDNWPQRLSGGEQQRLAVARVLLAEPATIFLDEATASLDERGEATIYHLLRDLPWHPTIVSVGHRGTLRSFHDAVIDLSTIGSEPEPQAAP